MNKNSLGERLKNERERLNYENQSTIAEKVDVSREMWGKYERDKAIPGGNVIARLVDIGFDVSFLFTGQRSQPTTKREAAMLDNYRHTSEEGKKAIEAASAELAKHKIQAKKASGE